MADSEIAERERDKAASEAFISAKQKEDRAEAIAVMKEMRADIRKHVAALAKLLPLDHMPGRSQYLTDDALGAYFAEYLVDECFVEAAMDARDVREWGIFSEGMA